MKKGSKVFILFFSKEKKKRRFLYSFNNFKLYLTSKNLTETL